MKNYLKRGTAGLGVQASSPLRRRAAALLLTTALLSPVMLAVSIQAANAAAGDNGDEGLSVTTSGTNAAPISGGDGVAGGDGAPGSPGKDNNKIGTDGGPGDPGGNGGNGGVGLNVAPGVSVTNIGTISGGSGGDGGLGGNGGDGGNQTSKGVSNGKAGNGGNGGAGGNGGNGGIGIVLGSGSTLINTGTITGGTAGRGVGGGDGGFQGAAFGKDSTTGSPGNPGAPGNPGLSAVGVSGSNAFIINSGTISGGQNPDLSYAHAVEFTGGNNRLELQKGWSFQGNVVGYASGTNTLVLGGDVTDLSGNPGSTVFNVSQLAPAGTTAPPSWTKDDTFQYYNFNAFEKTGNSTWRLTGTSNSDASWTISGGVLQAGGSGVIRSTQDINLNGGTLDLNGNSLSVGNVTNAGIINMGTGTTPGTVLTVNGNYAGHGGWINFNTALNDPNFATDRMVVTGSTSGTTYVGVTNPNDPLGLLGLPTKGNGIMLVQVGNPSASTGIFTNPGRIAAGAYEYNVAQGSDGSWYLQSTGDPAGGGDPPSNRGGAGGSGGGGGSGGNRTRPNDPYRSEVPLDMAIPGLAGRFGLAMIDNFDARGGYGDGFGFGNPYDSTGSVGTGYRESYGAAPGAYCYTADGQKYQYDKAQQACVNGWQAENPSRLRVWGRVLGETGSVGSRSASFSERFQSFQSHGPGYDYDLTAIQAGVDLNHTMTDIAGIYVGVGRTDSTVQQVYGGKAGTAGMDAYSLGGYWTHRTASGLYTDAILQNTWYDDIRTQSVGNPSLLVAGPQVMKTNGWGIAASLQTGYPIAIGRGLVLEPQAQVIYQHLSINAGADSFGLVHFGDTDNVYGRIGGRLSKGWMTEGGIPLKVWGLANIWHQFGSDATTTFSTLAGLNPVSLNTTLGGTWAQFGLGVSGQITHNVSVFGTGEYNVVVANGDGHSWGGRAGIKVGW